VKMKHDDIDLSWGPEPTSARVRNVPGWGFGHLALFDEAEAFAYHSQFKKARTVYVLFNPQFPTPSRAWIQATKPYDHGPILLYPGFVLDELPKYFLNGDPDTLELLVNKDVIGPTAKKVRDYFALLGLVISKKVVPYVYSHPRDDRGAKDENHIDTRLYEDYQKSLIEKRKHRHHGQVRQADCVR
jgi:hypothetical protein